MSKVIRIESHPAFNRIKDQKVSHGPIFGLDGGEIDNEFMSQSVEQKAVVKFLCDMGFVVHNRLGVPVASYQGFSDFPSDWISMEVPPSFASLSYACGMYAFRSKDLTRPQMILFGRLGIAANLALTMWKQAWKIKAA